MTQLSAAEAAQFAQRWLPAWTGNDPQRLAAFYSDDALYVDPGIPAEVTLQSGPASAAQNAS